MKYIVIVLFIASLALGYKIYEKKNPNLEHEQTMIKILKSNGEIIDLNVKIADSEAKRQLGLMFVEQMAEKDGMIFVFETEEMRRMWMKNTLIPLDMLFVGSNKEILNIKHNAQPQSLDIIFSVAPSKYVIELNGGFAKKYGVEIGDRIEFKQ